MVPAPDPTRRFLGASLALALVICVAYLIEYLSLPFARGPIFDSVVYLAQAEAVCAGRFGDPTLLAFSPLYGYLLAALGVTGPSLLPIVLQLLFWCACVGLVFLAARRLIGPGGALLASVLFMGYGPFLFYSSKLMSDALGLLLAVGTYTLYTSPRFVAAPRSATFATGALAGAMILARASLLFVGPALALFAFLPRERGEALARGAQRGVFFSLGLALVLAGNGLWTFSHTGHFVPVIFVSRTVAATTQHDWRGNLTDAASGTSNDVSAWDVVEQARERLRGAAPPAPASPMWGIDVGGFLRGLPTKLLRTFADLETTFDYGYYGERSELTMLRALPWSFGALALFALLGAVALYRRDGPLALAPHLPFVLGTIATTTLFHPSTRYRLAMVPVLVLFAAVGLMRLHALTPPRRRAISLGIAGVLFTFFTFRSATYEMRSPALWHLRVAEGAAVAGDADLRDTRIREALLLAPEDPQVRRRIEYVEGLRPWNATPPRP